MSLSTKALLVTVSVSQWTARKLDRRAGQTVSTVHGADALAGNYRKALLPGARELEEVSRLARSLRDYVDAQTLPWETNGTRILPSKNYVEFSSGFSARKALFDSAVLRFVEAYPKLREEARVRLGDLFSESDYPSVDYVRGAFRAEARVRPLPDVGDFRTEVSAADLESMRSQMEESTREAMRDVWSRLEKVIRKATETLSRPDAVFRDSLIENIRETCEILPRLNVTDDPALESVRSDLSALASRLSPDVLRVNQTERAAAAQTLDAKLKSIESQMSVFMGGGPRE